MEPKYSQAISKTWHKYFSPAYDTARGLFWNVADDRLQMRVKSKSSTANSTSPKTRCAFCSAKRC